MKRLVVNGDDFGLSEGVNRGILEAHRKGILTSTTLLANGPAFDSAVAMARAASRLGVGVHLNLTYGCPVCEPSAVPSLVNECGQFFTSLWQLAGRMAAGKARLAEVEREWRAQIEKALAAGIDVTHLDGHKHVHMLPGLFPIALRLAREFRIPGVRFAVERPIGVGRLLWRAAFRRRGESARGGASVVLKQYLAGRALALAGIGLRENLHGNGVAYPRYFCGFTHTGLLDAAALQEILWNLPDGTTELMCHPGYVDSALRQTPTRLLAERETEVEALTHPETWKIVAALGIQLINYRALVA